MPTMRIRGWTAVLLAGALVAGVSRADTRTWDGGGGNNNASTKENWDSDTAPVAGDAIVLDVTSGKFMTWDTNISVTSWTQVGYTGTVTFLTKFPGQGTFTNFVITGDCILSTGVWTHLDNSTGESNRLCVTVEGNLTVGDGASIDADGLGYDANNGPGKASVSGGSYGGIGASITNNRTYGSFLSPTNLGSGGRQAAGGGTVRLTVGVALTNNGVISAGGQRGTSNHGGGAGGSIWLTVGSLGGGGVIRANGGLSKTGVNDGGGGGGRIAVVLTGGGAFTDFSGSVQAYGGVDSDGNYPAAAGTIYEETQAQGAGQGTLIVDNSNRVCAAESVTAIPSNQTWTVRHVLTRRRGLLAVEPLTTLDLTSDDVTSDDTNITDGIRLHGGSLLLSPGTLSITNWSLIVDGANSVTGNVRVCSGGAMMHSDNSTAETYLMNLNVMGNLTVNAGGANQRERTGV